MSVRLCSHIQTLQQQPFETVICLILVILFALHFIKRHRCMVLKRKGLIVLQISKNVSYQRCPCIEIWEQNIKMYVEFAWFIKISERVILQSHQWDEWSFLSITVSCLIIVSHQTQDAVKIITKLIRYTIRLNYKKPITLLFILYNRAYFYI